MTPPVANAPNAARLRELQAIVFDCDGVLTPGDLYYDEAGRRLLRFNSRDGFALALVCRNGLPVGILSGRPADIAETRFRELGVRAFVGRCRDKAYGVAEMARTLGSDLTQTAFVGDDLPDLGAFSKVGLRIAVADAADEVREAADWVLQARGGYGAGREVCEAVAKARGDWQRYIARARHSAAEEA